ILQTQPQSQSVFAGASATFSVDFSAPGLTTNVWRIEPHFGPEAETNDFPLVNSPAFVTVDYEFFSFPDRMRIFRADTNIWDTGLISGNGSFKLNLPPGATTNLAIVMNEEG